MTLWRMLFHTSSEFYCIHDTYMTHTAITPEQPSHPSTGLVKINEHFINHYCGSSDGCNSGMRAMVPGVSVQESCRG